MTIEEKIQTQREYFLTGETLPVSFRKKALDRLQAGVKKYEQQLLDAMKKDLGKSASEAYMTEVGLVLGEIMYARSHVRSWASPTCRLAPLANFPATQKILKDPFGVVLVMSPWNYPVLLTLGPVIAAIAAGNCVCVKPSAYSPNTSAVMKAMLDEAFEPQYVQCITGGREENKTLLDQHFDYIFFTGGVTVGKMVMEKAAQHLTPVTLELGGKSPVIIDKTANLRLAARRLAFGKWLNCGQTCIAPDYVLCHKDVRKRFVELVVEEARKQYGEKPLDNCNYGKMVNEKHFLRVRALINKEKTVWGGESDEATLRIAPTVMDGVTEQDAVMQEEIFGPVLPIIEVESMDEAYDFVRRRPHPLAFYLFTTTGSVKKRFLSGARFGGGCVNDTIMHIATHNLPFGGVGNSGMGAYHGKKGFDTFTHEKAVVFKPNLLDLPLRYQPYNKFKDLLVRIFL